MINIKKTVLSIVAAGTLGISSLQAHSLWINSMESSFHKPGHVMVGLGFGHQLPFDEPAKKAGVVEFNIVSSDGTKTALQLPPKKTYTIHDDNDFEIIEGASALQMIDFKKTTKEGAYTLEVFSKQKYITKYTDTKGNKRFSLKPVSELKNVKEVQVAMKHQAFAKSYFTVGKWSEVKPLGHTLEMTPTSDLSKVKVGDTVEFDVVFKGKPLSSSSQKTQYITASSNARGDLNPLFASVKKGKVKLKITHSGQWLLTLKHRVKEDIIISNVATLTFTVK